jgi:APA family basic amino acid/polyamine antiporter
MCDQARLKRELGTPGAVLLGLGSILGTGVFVSLGIAAGAAGWWLPIAVLIAGAVAACNALSSAQLAAAHPVSGGTYEYGYKYLAPPAGVAAGWCFLVAKSASAATAALGCAGYGLHLLGLDTAGWVDTAVALALLLGVTVLVISGLRRSNAANAVIVSLTLGVLVVFIVAVGGWAVLNDRSPMHRVSGWTLRGGSDSAWESTRGLLQASALMFVAYTGYGRVATLGEEVKDPRRTIPRAVIATLAVSATLYLLVALAALAAVGPGELFDFTVDARGDRGAAPLELAARQTVGSPIGVIVALGAIVAMLGVLLNLLLGLSRVVLAMGRRRDLPERLAQLDRDGTTPTAAVILVAVIIAGIALTGSVQHTWSLSAFTVLLYYGLTNAAALRLPADDRLYPRVFSWLGLIGCLGLAWWVDWPYLVAGLALVTAAWLFTMWRRPASSTT